MVLFETENNVKQQRLVRKPLKNVMLGGKKTPNNNLKTKGFSILSLDTLTQDISFQRNYKSSCAFILPQAASFTLQVNASAGHPFGYLSKNISVKDYFSCVLNVSFVLVHFRSPQKFHTSCISGKQRPQEFPPFMWGCYPTIRSNYSAGFCTAERPCPR